MDKTSSGQNQWEMQTVVACWAFTLFFARFYFKEDFFKKKKVVKNPKVFYKQIFQKH